MWCGYSQSASSSDSHLGTDGHYSHVGALILQEVKHRVDVKERVAAAKAERRGLFPGHKALVDLLKQLREVNLTERHEQAGILSAQGDGVAALTTRFKALSARGYGSAGATVRQRGWG